MSKKTVKKASETLQQEDVVQAVVMCDSFSDRFEPLSHFKPTVLQPLVNSPLLDYTLEFLALGGVQEVILFCVAHAELIKDHIKRSKWNASSTGSMTVTCLVSEGCRSLGDAMRDIDAKAVIRGDFVLLYGDTIANVPLLPVIEKHKRLQKADKGAVMTLIYKEAAPGHMVRPLNEQVLLAVDSNTSRVLFHQKLKINTKKILYPLELFVDNPAVDLLYNMADTNVCICSNAVPSIFSDNFDFQTRDDFVRGLVLNEEILASTMYCHRLRCAEYASRVDTWPAYQAVSHDIIHRWTYPLVPDAPLRETDEPYMFLRQNVYRQRTAKLAKGCVLREDVVIAEGSTVGQNSVITRSVIGRNVHIGNNVNITDSYVWDNVNIQDKCVISQCLIADGCQLAANVKLSEGCILCPDVHLPSKTELSGVNLVAAKIDSTDDYGSGLEFVRINDRAYACHKGATEEGSEDEGNVLPPPGLSLGTEELEAEEDSDVWSASSGDLSDRDSPLPDDTNMFYLEVLDSLTRGYEEKLSCDNLILEINSSRYAYNVSVKEVNFLVVKAILNLPQGSDEYLLRLGKQLMYFLPILANYIKRNKEAQMDCLQAVEEVSESRVELRDVVQKVLLLLYNKEIIEERSILEWYNYSHQDLPGWESLRQQVAGFVKWLQEADEESDSDESD